MTDILKYVFTSLITLARSAAENQSVINATSFKIEESESGMLK